ncbi:hypothetical protein EPN44_03770 [bacterium]|nr:MAG: hypothetical protein EPN44_03770 [bacterium]
MGQPSLYCNAFALDSAVIVAILLFKTHWLFAMAMLTAAVCAAGGVNLARSMGAGVWAQTAAALMAVLNPWTYTEVIAGHLFMVMAFGALLWLAAELLRTSPRPLVVALLTVVTLQQLQFFVVAALAVVLYGVRSRRMLPVANVLVLAVAGLVGLAFSKSVLLNVPYTLAWESSQSIAPAKALLLQGYFARYTASWGWTFQAAVACQMVIAAAGIFMGWRSRRVRVIGLLTAALLLYAMGTLGPLAPIYNVVAVHVPVARLFRELYDIVGLVLIGVIALAAASSVSARGAAYLWLTAALVVAGAWVWMPPSRYWVDGRAIPRITVSNAPNTRYALLPAFQPLRFQDRGSGADPDALMLSDGVVPLNMYFPRYPVGSALAEYAQTGDTATLSALSVSEVIARPWLATDTFSLSQQSALPLGAFPASPKRAGARRIDAAPMLALLEMPAIGSVVDRIGGGNIFFGDAAGLAGPGVPTSWRSLPRVTPIVFSHRFLRATDGWIDARLGFIAEPRLAQAFGGALTTARRVPLRVAPGIDALVYVRGRLVGRGGEVISGSTRRYKWVRVPPSVSTVTCDGECVVAVQGIVPRGISGEPTTLRAIAIPFRGVMPWLAVADIPHREGRLIRYNVAFNRNWVALFDGKVLSHVRVDMTVNGWLLPEGWKPGHIIIIEYAAAIQALFEVFGIAWIVALLALTALHAYGGGARKRA